MASGSANLSTFRTVFAERMRNAGFPSVDNARMQGRLMQEGLWKKDAPTGIVQAGEDIYNRGINSRKSSFFVFVKSEPGKGQVSVYYYNPDSSANAPMRERIWVAGKAGNVKPGQEYLIRKVYNGSSDPTAFADQVLSDILHYASLKPESEYRMESHIHCGHMPQGYANSTKFADDGMSQFEDIIRMNALYARDLVSITSHNSFDEHKFFAMQIIAEEMGMIMVPGMELTAPANKPNGPHVLIWFGNEMDAHEGALIALTGRSKFQMQPFNDGPMADKVLPLLRSRLKGMAIMCAAHPFNLQNAEHPIYDVGMVSAMKGGPYTPDELMDMFSYVDAVEAWNITMTDTCDIPSNLGIDYLNELVHEVVSLAFGGTVKPSPNAFANGLAKYLNKLNSTFGTDDHNTTPMNYVADGAPQAMGHTVLDLASIYATLSAKPTSEELIRMLSEGKLNLHARVFTEIRNGYLQVPWGRREMNPYTQKLRDALGKKGNEYYVEAILSDLATFKLNTDEMHNLAQSYGWAKS